MKSPSEVLKSFEEWNNDWNAHVLFCAYDNDPSEEFKILFWKRALNALFEEHIENLSINFEDLKLLTKRKGRIPTGLEEIVKELIKRGILIDGNQLNEQVQDKQASQTWKTWAGRKIYKLWKAPESCFNIISSSKLKKKIQEIQKFCLSKQKNIFELTAFKDLFNLNESDLKVVLNYLDIQNLAGFKNENLSDETLRFIKIKVNDYENLEIEPQDTVLYRLTKISQTIENKIEELNKNVFELNKKTLQEIKNGNKPTAKRYLMMKKLNKTKIEELMKSKLNIDQQMMNIDQSIMNRGIISTLKISNEAMKKLISDIGDVDQVLQESQELIEKQNDISQSLADPLVGNDEDVEDEFDNLLTDEIPSVPDYDIIKKRRKITDDEDIQQDFEESEESREILEV